jgi:hypothetical protein
VPATAATVETANMPNANVPAKINFILFPSKHALENIKRG